MHDDLILNERLAGGIRCTSSDAYYINPYHLDNSTYCERLSNSSIDAWINTDEILEVVRPFMVPRDIDDGSFAECDECNTGSNITNLFLEE